MTGGGISTSPWVPIAHILPDTQTAIVAGDLPTVKGLRQALDPSARPEVLVVSRRHRPLENKM